MPEQLSFEGFDDAAPATDRLLFLIYPEAAVAEHIAGLIPDWAARHGLRGKPIRRDILHITLNHIGDFSGLPADLIALSREAARSLSIEPFQVTFDRVGGFGGKPGQCPFVLRGGAELDALTAFRADLVMAMRRTGARLGKQVQSGFHPHVTLLYGDRPVAEHPIAPIAWSAREFALVHSLQGQTKHVVLDRWPLRG